MFPAVLRALLGGLLLIAWRAGSAHSGSSRVSVRFWVTVLKGVGALPGGYAVGVVENFLALNLLPDLPLRSQLLRDRE